MSLSRTPNGSNANLKIVKTELRQNGEAVQLVRPMATTTKSSDQIVGELVNRFDYKNGEVKANENELNAVQQAFGTNLAQELIKTYEGSNLVSDSQQDLIGERYLAEQIRLIQEQQKTTSILDKWSHLLYEGEKDYKSSETQLPPLQSIKSANGSTSEYSFLAQQQQQHQSQNDDEDDQEQVQNSLEQLQKLQELHIKRQQQEQQLRSSMTGQNSVPSFSSQSRLIQNQSDLSAQAGLQSRTLSEIRLQAQAAAQAQVAAQLKANADSQIRTRSQQQTHSILSQASVLSQASIHSQNSIHSQASALSQTQAQRQQQQSQLSQHSQHSQHSQSSQQSQHSQRSQQSNKQSEEQNGKKSTNSAKQPQPYLPQLSSSNLKTVNLEAYNSPQFKAMLDQVTKPMTVPPEVINYPPDWPSQDKINLLAEPIYIPAPEPIVIPAPNIITLPNPLECCNSCEPSKPCCKQEIPESVYKPTVSYYPSIATDQEHMKNFGIRQLNVNGNLERTESGSNLGRN